MQMTFQASVTIATLATCLPLILKLNRFSLESAFVLVHFMSSSVSYPSPLDLNSEDSPRLRDALIQLPYVEISMPREHAISLRYLA
jgi:hypothetical protein